MVALFQIAFGSPWILAGLAVLPILWWLLKVTPPVPRRIAFPAVVLLGGLKDEEQTPAKTPWWLLALRLLVAALVIIALADPLLGRSVKLSAPGPLVLVVDNGWTAAKDWAERQSVMMDLLRGARDRPVAILPTASSAPPGLLDAGAALRFARALTPMPWAGDRAQAAKALGRLRFAAAPALYWLSDGLAGRGDKALEAALNRFGGGRILAPGRTALGLLPVARDGSGFSVAAIRAPSDAAQSAEAAAIGRRGETLAVTRLIFPPGAATAKGHIALPMEVRNETRRLVLVGEESAGAVQLLDTGAVQHSVGLVSEAEGEAQPLLSDVYYLEKALSPYADVQRGTISALLAKHVSVLLLADIARISGSDHAKVADFVDHGGVLIRFAGPRMQNGADDLVPVRLRAGGRYLGSAMAWAAAQHLAPFGPESPFNGLPIPAEVTVSRQILAEPSSDLAGRTWARLADGTPLITARAAGRGWLVLFHITASPGWSSLPLSGLYVDMLRRLLALSSGTPAHQLAGLASLAPVTLLDGLGHDTPPGGEIAPVPARDFARLAATPAHPPGLYGAPGAESALNLVGTHDRLAPLAGARPGSYGTVHAIALEPWLLALAALLLLADMVLSYLLRGLYPRRLDPRRLGPVAAALALLLMMPPHPAKAGEAENMKAALDTRLAYVKTGLPDVDRISQAGLTGLGLVLKQRTSYEPLGPVGVDLEQDDLSFYPLLYWPMDPREKALSPKALSKISDFMREGGTILFDTRDLTLGPVRGPDSPGEQTLRRITQGLDMPPLQPVPSDHVLTKSFYLLHGFPGRWSGGQVWVEALPPPPKNGEAPARGGDGVSPVVIGGNDWAAAWAVDPGYHFLSTPVPGGEMQREAAFRFGVNLVMYALTGNYKADQVHAPALLRRMGR
jgi:hypothetical protein